MFGHLIFDMGNVLLIFDPERTVRSLVGDSPNLREICRATMGGPEWKELDRGSISEEEALGRMISRAPEFREEIELVMARWDELLTPVEGMQALLEELKSRGYTLHLLSNASLRFFQYWGRYPFSSLFNSINVSAQMRMLKPEPGIYRALLRQRALSPEECLFVDDLEENVAGAQAVGIHGLRFQGEEQLRVDLHDLGVL